MNVLPNVVRAAVLALLCVACGAPAERSAAAADSAALAAVPPGIAAELGVRALLTPAALADTTIARCEPLGSSSGAARGQDVERKRRLRARLADGSRTVLYVRAARGDTIRRVELVRRDSATGRQRGFIWDAAGDSVQSLIWAPGARRPEVTTLPRGEPTAGALRALGRRLLALRC